MSARHTDLLRFITQKDIQVEQLPAGVHDWMSRPGLTDADELMLVRVHMPPGQAHRFHRHPEMEEIIYILSGKAEQWVEEECMVLGPGEMAHIPRNIIHGTYNPFDETLVFLAILGSLQSEGPFLIDVFDEKPWCDLKKPME